MYMIEEKSLHISRRIMNMTLAITHKLTPCKAIWQNTNSKFKPKIPDLNINYDKDITALAQIKAKQICLLNSSALCMMQETCDPTT